MYYNRGIAHAKASDFDKAVQDYNEALSYEPSNATLYSYRGYAYRQLGNLEAAARDFTRALELDPSDQQSRNQLRDMGVER